MATTDFLAKLDGLQGRGPRYRAICPGHTSTKRTRSLAVFESPDGRLLVTCFAGCGIEAIVGAMGMDLADLFPPRVDDDKRGPRIRRPFPVTDLVRELAPQMVGAWMLLRKMSRGEQITRSERAAAARFADKCESIVQALP